MFKIQFKVSLAFIGIFLILFFSSCGNRSETEKKIASILDPAPNSSLEKQAFDDPSNSISVPSAETPNTRSTILSDTTTEKYISTPFPRSEHLKDGRKLVTGVVESVDCIDIQFSPTNEESEPIKKVLIGKDAQELFILLNALDCISVPNPLHYEMFEMDSAVTIKVKYIDKTLDIILSGGESESKMFYYRLLPEVGDFGDYGYIFSQDEDNLLSDAVTELTINSQFMEIPRKACEEAGDMR